MEDPVDFIGLVVIGAALAVPLLYGLSTLLGMKHRQFRPIFRRKQRNGTTGPLMDDQATPSVEQHEETNKQSRRTQW